jgi:hypothetical protein
MRVSRFALRSIRFHAFSACMRVHTKQQRAQHESRIESAPSRAVGSPDLGAVCSPEETGSRACVGACHSWHGPARSSPGTTDRPRACGTSVARPHDVQRDKWSDPQPDRPRCGSQRVDGIEFGPFIGRPDVAHEPPGRLSGRILPNIGCPATELDPKACISVSARLRPNGIGQKNHRRQDAGTENFPRQLLRVHHTICYPVGLGRTPCGRPRTSAVCGSSCPALPSAAR